MNKENLQKQIEEMKTKLADMEAELNKPEVSINYKSKELAEKLMKEYEAEFKTYLSY